MPLLTYDFNTVIAFGAEHSSLKNATANALRKLNLDADARPVFPEQSIFTRSDHYMFVRQGVPSMFLATGMGSFKKDENAKALWDEFFAKHYHKPSDDLSLPFNFDGGRALRRRQLHDRHRDRQRQGAADLEQGRLLRRHLPPQLSVRAWSKDTLRRVFFLVREVIHRVGKRARSAWRIPPFVRDDGRSWWDTPDGFAVPLSHPMSRSFLNNFFPTIVEKPWRRRAQPTACGRLAFFALHCGDEILHRPTPVRRSPPRHHGRLGRGPGRHARQRAAQLLDVRGENRTRSPARPHRCAAGPIRRARRLVLPA
jgi:hypothetical protein